MVKKMNQINIEVNGFITEVQMNELLQSCFGEVEHSVDYHLRGFTSPNQVCSVASKLDDNLIGSAIAWKMKFHPYCTYISITAHPFYEDEVNDNLLKYMESYKDIQFPLQTTVWESASSLIRILKEKDFKEVRRTNITTLNISLVPPMEELIRKFQLEPHLNKVKSLQDIASNEDLKAKVVHLAWETYKNTHTINPLGVHDLDVWEKMVFGEDTILEGSYIIVENSDIIAFALLHNSDEYNQLEFGWRGVQNHAASHLIILLTVNQVKYAQRMGTRVLEAEIDDTDPYSMEMLKCFPFSPSPTLLTFQKSINHY
jgi:hypothetical protein